MKDFLNDILISPFKERDTVSIVLSIAMWVCVLAILTLASSLLIRTIDSSFLIESEKLGTVTDRYIVPSHYTNTIMTFGGRSTISIKKHHETSYEIMLNVDGLSSSMPVPKDMFDSIAIGDDECVKCAKGRLFETIYIKSFCNEKRKSILRH